jgi:hypothetical protein
MNEQYMDNLLHIDLLIPGTLQSKSNLDPLTQTPLLP